MDLAQEKSKFCGKMLDRALYEICLEVYKTKGKTVQKKNDGSLEFTLDGGNGDGMDYYKVYEQAWNYPFLRKEGARNSLRFRRGSKGIIQECCEKPCSREYLKLYC